MNEAETVHFGGFLTQLRLAASFLTIVPILGAEPAPASEVESSFAWFPLVGALIGTVMIAEDWLLAPILGHAIRAVVIIFSLTAITGAVHLDALSDTFDAMGAGRDRGRALQILRDSTIGAFGASAIFFSLALKVVALAGLASWKRTDALIIAPALARWAMVAVSYRIDYLRERGAGSALLGNNGANRNLAIATAAMLAIAIVLISGKTLAALALAVLIALAMRRCYLRWLGGVTGDLIGACGEIVETIVLIVFAS